MQARNLPLPFIAALALCSIFISPPAAAADVDVDALITELEAKRDACLTSFKQDRNKAARGCTTACASAVKNTKITIQRPVYTAADLDRYKQHCDAAMKQAGLSLGAEVKQVEIQVPTLEERLAALHGKTAHCKSRYEALNCRKVLTSRSTPELVQACQTYNGCSCDADRVAYNIANKEKLPRPNMAMGKLDTCERYYLQAEKLPALN